MKRGSISWRYITARRGVFISPSTVAVSRRLLCCRSRAFDSARDLDFLLHRKSFGPSRRDFGRSGKSPSPKGLASACEALSSSALVTKGSPIGLPGSRGNPLSYDNRPMLGDVERDRARVGLYPRDGPPRMRADISDKIRFENGFFAKIGRGSCRESVW